MDVDNGGYISIRFSIMASDLNAARAVDTSSTLAINRREITLSGAFTPFVTFRFAGPFSRVVMKLTDPPRPDRPATKTIRYCFWRRSLGTQLFISVILIIYVFIYLFAN